MWLSATRLPHLLPPAAYFDPGHHERELAGLFRPGWHFAATTHDLPRPGSWRRCELPHGEALLRREGDGYTARFGPRPYHERAAAPCRLERLGALLLVCTDDQAPGLREALDPPSLALAERLFLPSHRQVVSRRLEHPCNWKIPLENVLESYHVPSLHDNFIARHPGLFRVFSGRRGGPSTVHELHPRSSSYHDSLGADSAAYRALIERVRPGASAGYVHHHVFPNVVLGHTSIVSFLQVVVPLGPRASASHLRLSFDLGAGPPGLFARAASPALEAAASRLIAMVLREDAAVYPDVQRGLEASEQPGVLGSREERIFHFHQHVERACGGPPQGMAPTSEKSW